MVTANRPFTPTRKTGVCTSTSGRFTGHSTFCLTAKPTTKRLRSMWEISSSRRTPPPKFASKANGFSSKRRTRVCTEDTVTATRNWRGTGLSSILIKTGRRPSRSRQTPTIQSVLLRPSNRAGMLPPACWGMDHPAADRLQHPGRQRHWAWGQPAPPR